MSKQLRVLQMIDSLSIGGAERVSVNYANALAEQGIQSFLCATREEGMLKEFVQDDVAFFFMKKQKLLDIKAYYHLINYISDNQINIIHAHSSSFFTAVIVKLFTRVKIVWHDHYGNSEKVQSRPSFILKLCSLFFSHVISVNYILEKWAKDNLYVPPSRIEYIPNYADLVFDDNRPNIPGHEGKRIVVLANLRPQKDHITLLKAFKNVLEIDKEWSLLLVGRDWNDEYSQKLKDYIMENTLSENIFILGGRSDTAQILKHCDIGILSSKSEGLPVALLEYGLAQLPVISTKVGECATVLDSGRVGSLVEVGDFIALGDAISDLIADGTKREVRGQLFHEYVKKNYSKEVIINQLIKIYDAL